MCGAKQWSVIVSKRTSAAETIDVYAESAEEAQKLALEAAPTRIKREGGVDYRIVAWGLK